MYLHVPKTHTHMYSVCMYVYIYTYIHTYIYTICMCLHACTLVQEFACLRLPVGCPRPCNSGNPRKGRGKLRQRRTEFQLLVTESSWPSVHVASNASCPKPWSLDPRASFNLHVCSIMKPSINYVVTCNCVFNPGET